MSLAGPRQSGSASRAFLVLPSDTPGPEGLTVLGRLDRFDLAVPVASRMGLDVLVLSQRLVDADRGWDAVRGLMRQQQLEVWVYADAPERGRQAWSDLPVRVLGAIPPDAAAARHAEVVPCEQGESGGKPRRIVVLGAKGGSGKTFLAANLAAALAGRGQRVALVDLDFESGDLALRLGLEPGLDLTALPADLSRHARQAQKLPLTLWAAPAQPELASLADEALVSRLLATAATGFAFTVVDTPGDPDQDSIYIALERADLVILVSTLNPGAVRQCRVMVDLLRRLNYPVRERLCVVLNRVRRRALMTPAAAADLIGHEPEVLVPEAAALADSEAYYGRPSVVALRRGPLLRSIRQLADRAQPHVLPRGAQMRRAERPALAARVKSIVDRSSVRGWRT